MKKALAALCFGMALAFYGGFELYRQGLFIQTTEKPV